jgi:hypothetical protein
MIEVEVDNPYGVAPGDSGALVCVDSDQAVRPFALMVAAVRKATLPGWKSRTRTALYALPLCHISATNGLEVW